MKLINIFLVLIICTICSCRTIAPPLTESEIPWQMPSGTYVDSRGVGHLVEKGKPRWSVSEVYLYEAVSEAEPEEKSKWVKVLDFAKNHWVEGSFLSIFLFGTLKYRKRE